MEYDRVNDVAELQTLLDATEDIPDLDSESVDDLWDIVVAYCDQESDGYLLLLPEWFTQKEFDFRRPFMIGQIEFDRDDKGAVLFSDTHIIDVSIVENGVWDVAEYDETIEQLDISDEDDHIDEPGLVWIPRTLMTPVDIVE
jgi:hypothetical protein